MIEAANILEFEKAALLRDQVKQLKGLFLEDGKAGNANQESKRYKRRGANSL